MSDERQNLIDSYLRGEMDAAERERFEQEVENDPELHENLMLTRSIADGLADRQAKLDMMAQWDEAEQLRRRLTRYKRIRRWEIGIASAAAIFLVGYFVAPKLLINNRSGDIATTGFEPGLYRGESDALDTLYYMVDSRQYAAAARRADSLATVYDTRIEVLNRLDTLSDDQSYDLLSLQQQRYEARWLQIKSLAAEGRTAEAVAMLEEFATLDGDHRSDAVYLLDLLKR